MPPNVSLAGLSAPRFDGVNFFRTPTAPFSTVDFTARSKQFVQLEYQLYSPSSDVTGILKLNGRVLDQTTFPAGQFIPNVVTGAFVSAGAHRFTLEYRCQAQPCAAPLSQYWTRLGQLPSQGVTARQDAGLGAQRWWLDAPDSPLKITGAGPLFFDGTSFVRRLPEKAFELSWTPGQGEVLSASLLIYASQPFRVTTRGGGEVLDVQSGDSSHAVSPAVSVLGQPKTQSLTVEVDCLKRMSAEKGESGHAEAGQDCAFLYLPQVVVLIANPDYGAQTGGATLAALLVLTGLWRWLRLAPGRGAAAG
ncbi:hypothetical protein [Deinococcus frigens]|uniref:hypothetical protein n=1 Tax=Deinococcus frigens TaxID=249403 RepID=UPI0004965160|nr:hypothetical protein [Deinococcus frigens]